MADSIMQYALRYAEMGLAVFPLVPNGKQPATKNGCKNATTDKRQIERWWRQNPHYNIGMATGKVSGGIVVIDLDIDREKGKDGYEVFKKWQQEHGELPETWQSITGRGGYHLFYKDNAKTHNRTNLYDGIDIRGDGGYVVAPPSIHPNGRTYEWENDPSEVRLASVDKVVSDFLAPVAVKRSGQDMGGHGKAEHFHVPEGERTNYLFKMVSGMQAKGASDTAIMAAVRAENESKCIPPLTDRELEKEVFTALRRYEKGTATYKAVLDNGKFRQLKKHSLEMVAMDAVEEKPPDWLITGYMPRYQITTLAGDGGSGKTTVWCALAAAVSSGVVPFLLEGLVPFDYSLCNPDKVVFFSAEDSFEHTLKRRLRKNGARLENIFSIDIADERFQDVKFNSPFLEHLLAQYRPTLCIFDPIQAFVPPEIKMGDRNAMRACLAPLVGYGEKYGTTFLVVVHANKQANVWGRKRIADSADIWDISRSVIMAGESNEQGIRYLSHEKSNYGITASTVLYSIDGEVIRFKGYAMKKDKDFITEADHTTRQAPQRDEAKEFILDYLKDGEKPVAELDEMGKAVGLSMHTLSRGKTELKKDGKLQYRSCGKGHNKKFYISLTPFPEEGE